jgi:RNA polymerase sigma-70 factor (ECF subfamily)
MIKNKSLNYLRHQMVTQEAARQIREEHRLTMQASLNSLEALNQEAFYDRELEKALSRALDSLSERCRTIFRMSRIEGKKQREIAAELNISINTIETQMSIAYKKLRMALKDYLPLLLILLNV